MRRTAAHRRVLAGTYTVTVLRLDMPEDANPEDVISSYELPALDMVSAVTAAKERLAADEQLVEINGPVTGITRTEDGRWKVWGSMPDEAAGQ